MGINEDDVKGRKRQNAFGEFVDKSLGNGKPSSSPETDQHPHAQKKVKLNLNSEAPLMSFSPLPPLPQHLLSSFFQHNFAGTLLFQLFVSRSFGPPPASSSSPPVYILKVRSASETNGEVEAAGNRMDGGATAAITETRLVAEGQFLLRSRL